MRDFSTPPTLPAPTSGNLTDDVVTNARDHADTVVFSRPAEGSATGADATWTDVTQRTTTVMGVTQGHDC